MAEVLEQHNFESTGIHGKYPWPKWLDGQIWKLRQHVDYDCTTESFKQAAYAWSKRHTSSSKFIWTRNNQTSL